MASKGKTVRKARKLRREMSLPEVLLWQVIRVKPSGMKFRRQHPVGPYILDFYCTAAKLAIEIDGIAHNMGTQPEHDIRRDMYLNERGIGVMRIPAQDILNDTEKIADALVRYVETKR